MTARAELKVRQLFNRLFSHQNETHETYQQWSPDCFVGTVCFLEFVIWLNESSFFRLSILFLSVYYALVCVFAAILVQLDKKTEGRCGLNADQIWDSVYATDGWEYDGQSEIVVEKKDSLGTRAVVIEYEKVVMFAHPSGTHEFMWTRLRFIIHLQHKIKNVNAKGSILSPNYDLTLIFATHILL